VFQLKIEDSAPGQYSPGCYLTFDLKDVLRAFGPEALEWIWTASNLDAIGECYPDLEALEQTDAEVAGSRLLEIADGISQVIWGEFNAYRGESREVPWVRVVAFDGSWFEVWCEDKATLLHVAASFKDTTLTAAKELS
jgi:hypothetical protein